MTDTQWDTWEVFHQSKRGDPHEHVGAVHAPNAAMARQIWAEGPEITTPHSKVQ